MADVLISGLPAIVTPATDTLVPVQRSGATTAEGATLAQLAPSIMQGGAGFTASGSGAVNRAPREKLRDFVSPYDYGVTGDGTTDDTAAWQAALATGRTVYDPRGGSYKITGPLSIAAAGQAIIGAGPDETVFLPNGTFTLFSLTANNTRVENLSITGTSHAGGVTFSIVNANRGALRNIRTTSAVNFCYMNNINVFAFVDIWSIQNRGTYSYYLDGRTNQIQVVSFERCIASGNASFKPIGIDMDGAVNTVYLNNSGILTGHGRTLWVRNTAATSIKPSLIESVCMSFEFCDYGPQFDDGFSFEFANLYSHGHAISSGVTVGAGVPVGNVRITNAKLTSNARYGAETSLRQYLANVNFSGNSLGNTAGTWAAFSPRFEVDGTAYFQLGAGDPVLAFDANDYIGYDRTNNVMGSFVNGTAVYRIGDSRIGFFGATAALKPTVTGSRGGNAALASLLTALDTLGLITNSSS